MTLKIRPQTSIERRMLFIETLMNSTDKISKVSPGSANFGIASGVSKIAEKAEKDIILSLSQLFPENATGAQLDDCALRFGIAPRFTVSQSSTYIRVSAAPGTFYNHLTTTFQSNSGINFQLESSFTMNSFGYDYVKVKSTTTGSQTNVDPLTINKVTPIPVGHLNVINETLATGGRDLEDDETFRLRIKDGSNVLARGTLSMVEQKFMSINEKVLRVFYNGINSQGKVRLSIATVNGVDLDSTELAQLLDAGSSFFALTEYKPFGTSFYGVELVNVQYQNIDVSFRVLLDGSYNSDNIRKQIQIAFTKYLDFRFFDTSKQRVEWDNLLQIVKSIPGVLYVPDQYFYPQSDIVCDIHKLPRLRGFLMLDMNGNIIQNFTGTLLPVYYPSQPDFSYQQTVLNNI